VAQQDLDSAEAQLGQADAQMKIQQANVDSAKVDLSRCTIYSPIDGIVLDRQCDIGNTVAASLNAPTLFTIAQDLSKMQIDTAVAEADIGNVASGQDVNFTVDAFPNQQFNGKVTQMRNSPKTVSNVVTYDVIIEVHNENERLKPGMTANVSIIVDRASNVLRVVNSALRVRIPAELLSKIAVDPAATGHETTAPAAKPMTDDERRAAMRQIMQEVGFTRGGGGGQPAPEILQKAQQLAKERGLDLDFNQFAGGGRGNRSGGRGERGGGRSERAGSSPASSSPGTTRTLYKLAGSNPRTATIEAARVKLGITDGIYTAVLDGLTQGDILITSVSLSGSTSSPTEQPTTNPFIGRGGGGGRGGRGGF
jgi:HlyD family secretion protein